MIEAKKQLKLHYKFIIIWLIFILILYIIFFKYTGYKNISNLIKSYNFNQFVNLSEIKKGKKPFFNHSFVFLGKKKSLNDLFLISVESINNKIINHSRLINLSESPLGEETNLNVFGTKAIYSTKFNEKYINIILLDFNGEYPEIFKNYTFEEILRSKITNLIETSFWNGINKQSYQIRPPADTVSYKILPKKIEIEIDGENFILDKNGLPEKNYKRIIYTPSSHELSSPLLWAVDTVRSVLGRELIEFMEYTFFNTINWLKSFSFKQNNSEIQNENKQSSLSISVLNNINYGYEKFPPKNLDSLIKPSENGEGIWEQLNNDPFIKSNHRLSSPFATTFIRPDTERHNIKIYITIWDPRQVEMHMVAGTNEPKSITGARGTGLVPREDVDRLVAGFNGGFQSIHAEYGMVTRGVVFIPPKPYGATVAELNDGRIAFGSWDERRELPSYVVSIRQNLTALVQDFIFNPYKRVWWGAAPEWFVDPTITTRSGVCLTREHYVAYFWGADLSHTNMANAMLAAHCVYGVHLDMNPGHTGFEFYKVGFKGIFNPLTEELNKRYEAEGEVYLRPNLWFRSKRMIKYMGHIRFPRYIKRDARDFFYLLLKNNFPDTPLKTIISPSIPDEGIWNTDDIPQNGFPPAVEWTSIRTDLKHSKIKIVKFNLELLQSSIFNQQDEPILLSNFVGGISIKSNFNSSDTKYLIISKRELKAEAKIINRNELDKNSNDTIISGKDINNATGPICGVIGVENNKNIIWIEGDEKHSIENYNDILSLLKVDKAIAISGNKCSFFYSDNKNKLYDLDKNLLNYDTLSKVLVFYSYRIPQAIRLFPQTKVVRPRVWQPLM